VNKKHVGSNFEDFLQEEGLLADAEAVAVKRVIAFQVTRLMEEQNITKSEMSRRMNTSRAALERLLDPSNESVTLQTLDRAAKALGRRLLIGLV
jgi:DNA-binding Xre family transcriptional regulator